MIEASSARRRVAASITSTATAAVLLWSSGAFATSLPVFSVSVDGGPAVSFADQTACDGTKAVSCIGTGSAGDLVVSSFELLADPEPRHQVESGEHKQSQELANGTDQEK